MNKFLRALKAFFMGKDLNTDVVYAALGLDVDGNTFTRPRRLSPYMEMVWPDSPSEFEVDRAIQGFPVSQEYLDEEVGLIYNVPMSDEAIQTLGGSDNTPHFNTIQDARRYTLEQSVGEFRLGIVQEFGEDIFFVTLQDTVKVDLVAWVKDFPTARTGDLLLGTVQNDGGAYFFAPQRG